MKALFQVIVYLLPGHNAGAVPGYLLLQVPPGPGLAGGQGGLQGHVAEAVQGLGHEAAQAGQEAAVDHRQQTHRHHHQLQQAGGIGYGFMLLFVFCFLYFYFCFCFLRFKFPVK